MEKIIYYSRSNTPKARFAPSSSGFAPVYEERISKNGTMVLVKTGEHNINDFVQASLESTKIYNILDRFALGDTSVLEKVQGFYADVTKMPKTLLEAHNFMKSLSANFDKLDSETKEKFGNSYEVLISKIENGEFNKIISEIAQKKEVDRAELNSEIAQKKEGEK